jgi:hypothetical protein
VRVCFVAIHSRGLYQTAERLRLVVEAKARQCRGGIIGARRGAHARAR